MQQDESQVGKILSKELVDVFIRVGVIAILVVWCARVIDPFLNLLLWALILAVTLYPLHQLIANRIGKRQGRAATILVLSGLFLIGTPTVMLGSSFAGHIHKVNTAFKNNEVKVKPPAPSVAEWPVVGEKVYALWNSAAQDLPGELKKLQPQLKNFSEWLLDKAADTAGAVALFLVALIVAGMMMAYGESGSRAFRRIIDRLAGPDKGGRIHALSTATTRSVASGVLGVAAIQAILLGIGFLWAGVPGAGILALLVLLIAIMQLPALIISFPVIAYIWWSGDSTLSNAVITAYLLVATLADNFLKPVLLGRGVDAPMPVILLGAIGGMVYAGIIGLFIGAVVLAVGYQLFMAWVAENDPPEIESAVPDDDEMAPASD